MITACITAFDRSKPCRVACFAFESLLQRRSASSVFWTVTVAVLPNTTCRRDPANYIRVSKRRARRVLNHGVGPSEGLGIPYPCGSIAICSLSEFPNVSSINCPSLMDRESKAAPSASISVECYSISKSLEILPSSIRRSICHPLSAVSKAQSPPTGAAGG